ncbi:diphthine methyl ester synthase isoform X1 [Halyomorpha halys]|uniref:diphthine methyl ester synthase isoform X1 n=1 Tax=Halyomorpha halys TaxID=286706 RepID=UPI0006D4F649|nr:diphthine methyl ester synthase [Halyomorpha halys]
MFYVIGIGLGDAKDITVKGLEIVKSASRVYLEMFTSVLSVGKDGLEKFYGRDVIIADRELVEMDADTILFNADKEDVAFLVVGDPFGATTHTDLVLRAKQKQIPTKVVHNASIMNAIGCCGLQLYNFGETVSIPFWTDSWKPDSFFEKICSNKLRGLHTLCLLDIKVKEPTPESITKKKKEYLPPMFMTASEASRQLMEIVKNSNSSVIDGDTQCVGVARVGSDEQEIICCSLSEMIMKNLGKPLHSLVIVGKLHPLEEEYLNFLSN